MNFQTSTHKAHWLLDPQTLAARREEARAQALTQLKRSRETTPVDGATDGATGGSSSKRCKVEPPVSLEDEQLLRAYYEGKLKAVCDTLKLPSKVESTALQYIKRFYTRHSCLEHDPQRIMPTAIYVACKVEESYMSAEEFSQRVNIKPNVLLGSEVLLLQGLGFDLVVYSPYRALHGLFQELDQLRAQRSPHLDGAIQAATADQLVRAHGAARSAVGALLLTDAPLLHPPGLLAVAALRSGLRHAQLPCRELLAHVATRAAELSGAGAGSLPDGTPPAEALLATLAQVDELAVKQAWGQVADVDAKATDIDRSIKLWKRGLAAEAAGQPQAEAAGNQQVV